MARPTGRFRWAVLALLFVITTVNYMDRNILGVLKPTIQADLHFSETDFGDIVFFLSLGYAGIGWLTDKVGVRLGLAAAAVVWCLASTAHGLVASVGGFIMARVVLGLGEGGNFPACIKRRQLHGRVLRLRQRLCRRDGDRSPPAAAQPLFGRRGRG